MRLLVVRHGETDYNVQHLLTGQSDVPLNNRGEQQALAVGKYLASETLDVILSSDLQRARVTARAVAHHHGLTIVEDLRLRELSLGCWEGKTKEMVQEQFPEEYRLWQEDDLTNAPPGGETIQQLRNRLVSTLVDCFERYQDQTVV
jgi:2,3-bisphosphoglycerate-dependent phosphoglycerate mutase